MRNAVLLLLASVAMVRPAIAEPLATADGDKPDTRVEVTGLKHSGNTVTLTFRVFNDSSEPLPMNVKALGDESLSIDYGTVGGVHLIDSANKKKYFVIRDQNKNCVCSSGLYMLDPGKSLSLWAKFPPPPETVQEITVVVPHFIPMDGVPISR